jgi:HPt (histidine-containing phosphotransfer) domain-containing protein
MDTYPVVQVDADLADLIPQYLNNRWADLRFARQLLSNGDYFLLSRMAHRVRGSAASYGFNELGTIAEVLEAVSDAQDHSAVAAQLDAFEAFLGSVRIQYI